MADGHAHGDEDDRELADLRHRQPGHEPGALAVAHVSHDRHDDQRVADQHEQREHYGGRQLAAQGAEIHLGAQVDEEEQQQEVAQARQPGIDRLTKRQRGQREAGQEGPHLLAEAQPLAARGQRGAPGHGEDQKQLLRRSHPVQQPRQHITHQQADPDHDQCQLDRHFQQLPRPATFAGAGALGADHHHRDHHRDVLDDQEAHRDAPV